MTKVLIVDDYVGMRDGLAQILSSRNMDCEFITSKDTDSSLKAIRQNPDCSVCILDLNLNGEDGLTVLAELRKVNPLMRVLVYSVFTEPIRILSALKCGIQGYISKTADIGQIENALNAVMNGSSYYGKEANLVLQSMALPQTAQPLCSDDTLVKTKALFEKYKTLTRTEQSVFSLLVQKKEMSEIAAALKKSEKTVENQRSSIYTKLNVHDRLEAVDAAKTLGIL